MAKETGIVIWKNKGSAKGHEYEIRTSAGRPVAAGWTAGNATETKKEARNRVYFAVIKGLCALGSVEPPAEPAETGS